MGDIFTLLAAGLAQSFEPLNLFMIVVGCLAGLFIGAMPGLGSVNGVAILLPVTFLVPPTAAIIFLAALAGINPSLYEAARLDGSAVRPGRSSQRVRARSISS